MRHVETCYDRQILTIHYIYNLLKKNWYIPKANKKNKQKTPMHACMHFYISIPNNL